ncbi:MAG: (4Fe-4S)-binding protein [Firmicutes bacterium]|nr:(4Fe-4S)-binding protein [Candidatus Fermentithermobacillaceae bacterium]
MIKYYSNQEITVIWQPDLCNHNGNCWKSLGQVFDPSKRPWVDMEGADTESIIRVVNECPTGALTWKSLNN